MEKFPKIKDSQVVLVRSNTQHGTVLDESFKMAISNEQKVYTTFDQLEDALNYANKYLNETMEFEFTIFNSRQELLLFLNPYEIKRRNS